MICHECDEEFDELYPLKFGRKTLKLCEDCLELKEEELTMQDEAESAMKNMMGYKGSY